MYLGVLLLCKQRLKEDIPTIRERAPQLLSWEFSFVKILSKRIKIHHREVVFQWHFVWYAIKLKNKEQKF